MRSKWVVYAGSVAGKCWRPSCGFRWLLCVTEAKSGGCCPMRSRSCWLKPWQPRGLRAAQHRKAAACCPITSQHSQQVQPLPHRRSHHSEEPRKTMPPLAHVRGEAQQHIHQQRRPYLPADGVGVVTEEVAELERLLHLLEKDLNVPAGAIEVAHAARTPVAVVADEDHQSLLALDLDLDPGLDPAQSPAGERLPLRAYPVNSWNE